MAEETKVDEKKLKELDEQIEAKEKEKDAAYVEIGRKYFALNAGKAEPEYTEWIEQINAIDKDIKEIEAQKSEIKGFYVCECGTEVPKQSAFCPECGRKLVKATIAIPEGFVQCTKCSALVEVGAKFCNNCGEKMSQAEAAAPVEEPVAAPVEEPVVAPVEASVTVNPPVEEPADDFPSFPSEKRCAVCNEILDDGAMFCFNCGSKVER